MASQHPIWQRLRREGRYNLKWLAAGTKFSHSHVKAVAADIQPAGRRFRAACADFLNVPEGELFHDGNGSSASPSPEDSPEPELRMAALSRGS